MNLEPQSVQEALNVVALLIFVTLLGAGLFGLLRRLRLYFIAQESVPILMRRDIVLLGALALIGLESMGLRALGVALQENSWERVVYSAQQDFILLSAVFYWVWVELFDIDDPEVK